MKLSIIIPALNEASAIEKTLSQLHSLRNEAEFEIIVSDGGSCDKTVELARRYSAVVQGEKGRGAQLNLGARHASGRVFFFVHADMVVPKGALMEIMQKIEIEGFDGGGFSNVFSTHNRKIKRLGRIMNLRFLNNDHAGNLTFFGDNGIFVRREAFESLGGFKQIPIMEDYDFSKRMRDRFRVVRIENPKLIVSPRRHIEAGFFQTRFQWMAIKRLYQLGVSPNFLAKLYKEVR